MAQPLPDSAPALHEVLGDLRERLVGFAASRYGRESAEDLAQEVMVVLAQKYAHLDRPEDLVPVAFQVLRFKAAGTWRRDWRRGEHVALEDLPLAGGDPSPEDQAARAQGLERLLGAIRTLGPRCRELFRLKLDGLSFPEIRDRLGAGALNTVYTWDHRCRKQLLEKMGGGWTP